MSTISVPPPRRRIATYGKSARRPQYTLQTQDTSPQRSQELRTKLKVDTSVTAVEKPDSRVGKLVRPSVARPASANLDVFDVPLSDDETTPPKPSTGRARPSSSRTNPARNNAGSTKAPVLGKDQQIDQVAIPAKRKRTTPAPQSQNEGPNITTRAVGGDAKPQTLPAIALDKVASPVDLGAPEPSSPLTKIDVLEETIRDIGTAIESPRRTRTRATPRRPSIRPGKSAPALLKGILPELEESDPLANPLDASPTPKKQAATRLVKVLKTPPNRVSRSPPSVRTGSVTPRQTELLKRLLDESNVMPKCSGLIGLAVDKLHVPEQPPTKSPKLVRSRSDIPQTLHTRRVRLIDTLKEFAPVREENDDVDDVELASDDHKPADTSSRAVEPDASTSQDVSISQVTTRSIGGARVTYASQRSYLTDSNMDTDLLFDMSLQAPSPVVPRRRGLMIPHLTKSQSSLGMDGEDLEDSQGGMRSVHELRAAGGKKRFTDDMETLLDDIEGHGGSNLSRKRSAMIELCSKLVEKPYVTEMVDHGFDQRLLRACANASDAMIAFVLAAAVAFMIRAGVSVHVHEQIYRSGCLKTFASLVDLEKDILAIAKERRTNMSKMAQSSVVELRNLIKESALWTTDKPQTISPRTVALKSMELLVRALRENRNTDAILDESTISKLLDTVEKPVHSLSEGILTDGVDLELALSVLESCSVTSAPASKANGWSRQSLTRLADVLGRILDMPAQVTERIEILALRLCLNITNNNAKICELFAKPPLIVPLVSSIDRYFDLVRTDQTELEGFSVLDRLILSLGAMINLAEFSDTARLSVTTDGDHLLFGLIRSFLEGLERAAQADSVEESHSNVAYGYLAVLLGNLCQNDGIMAKVRGQLPGQSLDTLITAVEEFIQYHQKVDREGFDGEEGEELWVHFTERLRAVVVRMKAAEG